MRPFRPGLIVDPQFPLVWRLRSSRTGTGSLGDIGFRLIDPGRYLVGEFREVCATRETFVKQRPLMEKRSHCGQVTVDDAVAVIGRFRNGTLASLEATRFAQGAEECPNDRDQWERGLARLRS